MIRDYTTHGTWIDPDEYVNEVEAMIARRRTNAGLV